MDFEDLLGVSFGLMALLLALALFAFMVLVWWKIISRTGHSGWLAILMFIPLANFILMLVLAFGAWPIERELADLRSRAV